jgi:hypothetical protein
MVVRIRLGTPRKRKQPEIKSRPMAEGVAALLTPAALMASALGFWGLGADLHWTNNFAISSGIFSHWQVWLGTAALLQLGAKVLYRHAARGRTAS